MKLYEALANSIAQSIQEGGSVVKSDTRIFKFKNWCFIKC